MDKFVRFWAGIWEDEGKTPNKKWMEKNGKDERKIPISGRITDH